MKMASVRLKTNIGSRILLILEIIEWIFFLSLCVAGGVLTNDVIKTYQAKETTLGTSLKPITKLPVVAICNVYPRFFDIQVFYNYIHDIEELVIGNETYIETEKEYVTLSIF